MESKAGRFFDTLTLIGVGVPVVGLFLGGIYSLPAMRLCKGREPWLSVLLSAGLATTVLGIGYLGGIPVRYAFGAWVLSVILLLVARRLHGSLDGNVERFGLVHAFALVASFALSAVTGDAAPKP